MYVFEALARVSIHSPVVSAWKTVRLTVTQHNCSVQIQGSVAKPKGILEWYQHQLHVQIKVNLPIQGSDHLLSLCRQAVLAWEGGEAHKVTSSLTYNLYTFCTSAITQ